MSDIYYCSNAKSKRANGEHKGHSSNRCSESSDDANKNNNSKTTRDNNLMVTNGKCNSKVHHSDHLTTWNIKNSQHCGNVMDIRDDMVSTKSIEPSKVFHNVRCARHLKSHNHNHNHHHNHPLYYGSRNMFTEHTHHHHNSSGNSNDGGIGVAVDIDIGNGNTGNDIGDAEIGNPNPTYIHHPEKIRSHRRKAESVLSTDSDIRFTRRKLGDSQKCGCAVIAGVLIALLVGGGFVYVGFTYFKSDPLPDRIFRAKFHILNDKWTMDLANQKSQRFQQKARDYRERINLVIRRSDLREAYEGSEILALDGFEDTNNIVVHFNIIFDPYLGLVSIADLLALFGEEFNNPQSKYFHDIVVDPKSLAIREVTGVVDEPITSASPLGKDDDITEILSTTSEKPPKRCETLRLNYCRSIGYNITMFPNLLGHISYEEVQADVIAFRELVDAECFREAFDFVCRLLQPPCETQTNVGPTSLPICREYCEQFMKGCSQRLPRKFLHYFNCELFPESTGIQSCRQRPNCANDFHTLTHSPRLCDGYADCPDLSDERNCPFCPGNSLYCGRGRACIPRRARCNGKADCPDGSDEKDCLAIAKRATDLIKSDPFVPYLSHFESDGYAVFFEKGIVGKLCTEGLEGDARKILRQTVAESLCKSLGYESAESFDIRNDTELVDDYVRVVDPHAPEISFVRTHCPRREVLHVTCGALQCGVQSILTAKQHLALPKMAAPGDWPWLVALFREEIHVCDGTLVSSDWVLTTESCFQGQPRATWMAVLGTVRLSSKAPWTQRRRIIGMIKSPVEGSTAALIRLETSVAYSDHVRPICLPDELKLKETKRVIAKAELLKSTNIERLKPLEHETQQYFIAPTLENESEITFPSFSENFHTDKERYQMPKAEALTRMYVEENARSDHIFRDSPLHPQIPVLQYNNYKTEMTSMNKPLSIPPQDQLWTNCNTLGWARQREQLQRVQLKIDNMAACENISIATVNSMCTEATYQKHDCTQEEFSGAPVQCLMPSTNQWALIGISSWRIACAPLGIERPRMYDKIASNTAWIREIINSS